MVIFVCPWIWVRRDAFYVYRRDALRKTYSASFDVATAEGGLARPLDLDLVIAVELVMHVKGEERENGSTAGS